MAINDSTFYTDLYDAVRTLLVASSLQVTNSTTAATSTASILASYNDKKSSTPQVIIEPINKSEGPRYKFGSNEGKKVINVSITVYYKNTLGVDQLKQQIEVAMKGNEFDDLMLAGIDVDDAFINPNDAKYHSSTLTFSYDRE